MRGPTPSQTVGPFFGPALCYDQGPFSVNAGTRGAFWIRGQVFDGQGRPVSDALIETWQADEEGNFVRRAHRETFRGFARCATDAEGRYGLYTIKPGHVADRQGQRLAPFIAVCIFARGLLNRVVTRIYFADEPEGNASDPVLRAVASSRVSTLLAAKHADEYRFDIHLQGPDETVFFAV